MTPKIITVLMVAIMLSSVVSGSTCDYPSYKSPHILTDGEVSESLSHGITPYSDEYMPVGLLRCIIDNLPENKRGEI